MSNQPGTVERAYQLAREGKSLAEIKTMLRLEGYSDGVLHINSPSVASNLRKMAKQARQVQAGMEGPPSCNSVATTSESSHDQPCTDRTAQE
jgi:hypothetical protein